MAEAYRRRGVDVRMATRPLRYPEASGWSCLDPVRDGGVFDQGSEVETMAALGCGVQVMMNTMTRMCLPSRGLQ